jgi:hypothetical protein
LSEAGIATEDLRLVIVHDRRVSEDHAVVAARVDGRWLILDNRHMNLLTDMQVRNVTPLLALSSDGESLPLASAITPSWHFTSALIQRQS